MSSPEFAELRGINTIAATAKASILSSDRERSLIYFLQGISLAPGGLTKFTRQLLEKFPEKIGTPTMHRVGTKAGKVYSGEVLGIIAYEVGDQSGDFAEESDMRGGDIRISPPG